MRIYSVLMAILLVCCLTVPAMAADEATAKQIKDLEKARLVLQEDLARAQVQVDTLKDNQAKLQSNLNAEMKARQDLQKAMIEKDEQILKLLGELNAQLAANKNAGSADDAALKAKLEKALADMAAKNAADLAALKDQHQKDLAAMQKDYDAKLVALQDSLDKENAARLAAEEETRLADQKIVLRAKKDRTITYVMGAILAGISLAN